MLAARQWIDDSPKERNAHAPIKSVGTAPQRIEI